MKPKRLRVGRKSPPSFKQPKLRVEFQCLPEFTGNLELAASILQQPGGAKLVNMRDRNGSTPLYACAWYNRIQICELMCNLGANTNNRNIRNNTALMLAMEKGHMEIVHILLKYDAKLSFDDIKVVCYKRKQPIEPRIMTLLQQFKCFVDLSHLRELEAQRLNMENNFKKWDTLFSENGKPWHGRNYYLSSLRKKRLVQRSFRYNKMCREIVGAKRRIRDMNIQGVTDNTELCDFGDLFRGDRPKTPRGFGAVKTSTHSKFDERPTTAPGRLSGNKKTPAQHFIDIYNKEYVKRFTDMLNKAVNPQAIKTRSRSSQKRMSIRGNKKKGCFGSSPRRIPHSPRGRRNSPASSLSSAQNQWSSRAHKVLKPDTKRVQSCPLEVKSLISTMGSPSYRQRFSTRDKGSICPTPRRNVVLPPHQPKLPWKDSVGKSR